MGDFLFIRVVFFAFLFVGITLTILIIELVGRMLSRMKSYLQRREEWIYCRLFRSFILLLVLSTDRSSSP